MVSNKSKNPKKKVKKALDRIETDDILSVTVEERNDLDRKRKRTIF